MEPIIQKLDIFVTIVSFIYKHENHCLQVLQIFSPIFDTYLIQNELLTKLFRIHSMRYLWHRLRVIRKEGFTDLKHDLSNE